MKMTLTSSLAALILTSGIAFADNPNQACTQGNAAFCNLVGPAGPMGPQGPAGAVGPTGPAGANGTDGGFSGNIHLPAGYRVDAIGDGVARIRDPEGRDAFVVVNQRTVFIRADGGTATVNPSDRITNAHEAEMRNRAALIASLPPVDHPDYEERFAAIEGRLAEIGTPMDGVDGADGVDGKDGADGKDGRDGRDFDAAHHAAALASSTALAGLQYQSLSAGQTGWAAGIGGQFDGDAAIAIGINHGVADNVTLNASIASTFDGNGVSAFIGASGRF